ncbi:hypothetical protein M8818_001070 [Zalaria obscura]|uniref:Uncharacterized protein n=1 Tax=Zalaria obscura TaxID=2024903 RepID=A0ACC3SM62_9PEZI
MTNEATCTDLGWAPAAFYLGVITYTGAAELTVDASFMFWTRMSCSCEQPEENVHKRLNSVKSSAQGAVKWRFWLQLDR